MHWHLWIFEFSIPVRVGAMFKFGFSSEDQDDKIEDEVYDKCEQKWNDCKEILAKTDETNVQQMQYNTLHFRDVEIKSMNPNQAVKALQDKENLKEASVLKAEQNHSDLLPAVYEGGFKIWECTYDLINYLVDSDINFENKRVLDLGCGAGIVGIFTLIKGSTCYFQDYNSDVIEYITVPNVLLNLKDVISKCKFYSGDWLSFTNYFGNDTNEDDKFDFICTSETIYNTENYLKLHQVFKKLLKRNGIIFLAAKSFYFGVGGGISLFQDFIDKRKIFKYSTPWKCAEGVTREILMIQFND